MNCATCKVNIIGPKTFPYGGFLCSNQHLQCVDCNMGLQEQCGICKDITNFVQMNFNSYYNSLNEAQTRFAMSAVEKAPTASPLPSQSNIHSMGQPQSSNGFTKPIYADIDKQSKLSQEHLIMLNSKESLQQQKSKVIQENETLLESVEQILTKDDQCPKNITNKQNFDSMIGNLINNSHDQPKQTIETLFFRSTPKENPDSNFGYSFCNANSGEISGGPDIKVKNKLDCQINCKASKASGLNQNIFLFKEDLEDSNIVHTSEIRFMDSTDSLKNVYANEPAFGIKSSITKEIKHNPPFPSVPQRDLANDIQQPEILSIDVLQNFETHNTANRMEVIQNYLRNCSPYAFLQYPNYSCQHTYCDFGWEQQPQLENMAEYKKNACVSTDSAPSLKSYNVENSADVAMCEAAKFKTQDFFVMPSLGVSQPENDNMIFKNKFNKPNTDVRLQKILETFHEDSKIQNLQETPIEQQTKGNYMKLTTAATKYTESYAENHLTPIDIPQNQSVNSELPSESSDSLVLLQLLNTHRAFYNPPNDAVRPVNNLHTLPHPEPVSQEPPCSQFQTIPCLATIVQDLIMQKSRFLNNKPVPAYMLAIPRLPIKCPESTCQLMISVTDFNKHFAVAHSHLAMERIKPFQCKNFFLDPRLAQCGISKCHLLYLVRDQISDLGCSEYKDFLPLLVMTSRISLAQICGVKEDSEQAAGDQFEYFIIWITGIVPEEFPISVSLTIWSRSGKTPLCHVVYSGDMYSIRHSQEGLDVWQSGRMLLLSSQELDLLTNGGKDMLNLQLMVH